MQLLNNKYFQWLAFAVVGFLGLFLAAATLYQLKSVDLAESQKVAATTIVVSGKGEAVAIPDIATFSFSITKESETAPSAQRLVTEASNKVLDVIKKAGVAEKDIKTSNYSLNPKYDYSQTVCPAIYPSNCPPSKEILRGYEVSQTFEVKVRDITKAGSIVTDVTSAGVTNMYGPTFTVDKEDAVIDQARNAAIEDAKTKAEAIAKGLGVRLVRIVGFYDNDSSGPYYGDSVMGKGGMMSAAAPTAVIPQGENKYTKNVSITYEIR